MLKRLYLRLLLTILVFCVLTTLAYLVGIVR